MARRATTPDKKLPAKPKNLKDAPAGAKSVLLRAANEIRAAYKAGKKSIVIGEREYDLSLIAKTPIVKTTAHPEGIRVKEEWIVIKRADGSLTPFAQIERVGSGNSRADLI